jgi:hypothetical protein
MREGVLLSFPYGKGRVRSNTEERGFAWPTLLPWEWGRNDDAAKGTHLDPLFARGDCAQAVL